jgi:predicted extracellular nuclease
MTFDTAGGGGGGGGSDTSSGGGSDSSGSAGSEKSIVDIQKNSVTCGADGKDPQFFGEVKGITIRNAVVVSPGRKEGSGGTLTGVFVQQQKGGEFSGIYVVGKKDGELGTVKPGDVITITGDVKDFYCFTEIYATFVTIESQGEAMATPLTVTTDDLGDIAGKAKTEPYEGVLLQLQNVVVGEDALGTDGKPHGEIYVGKSADDKALRIASSFYGVYLSNKNTDGTFTPKYPKGTKLGTLTGVLEYGYGTYKLMLTQDPENVELP